MALTLELIALVEMLATWAMVCMRYGSLPAQIHTPFNGGGDAHGMAGKEQLWLLLTLSTVLYLLLTGIPRIPQLPVNVPAGTSLESIALVRRRASGMLLGLKVLVMAMFAVLASYSTGLAGREGAHTTLGLLSGALLVLVVVSTVRLLRSVRLGG
jgi:hypothetical protein